MTTVEDLHAVWPQVAPWIEAALEACPDQPETLLDVYALLLRDPSHYQLWAADSAVFVTHVVPVRGGTALHFWLCGGAMDGVQALYPLAEQFGHDIGCRSMTLLGRRGWERSFLSREGWVPSMVHLEKGLA